MGQSIPVDAPGGAYTITIAPGLLAGLGDHAPHYGLNTRALVITNDTLAARYGQPLAAALPDAALATMPDGEAHKTLGTVAALYTDAVRARLDRAATIVALGGGVVGDVAGFVAATYMRGVRLVQVPTSLLAMVDSSVGGKVGVDLPEGKNLVGAFRQPAAVLIDPDVLFTLPEVEWRCGMAEVLKHGLLADVTLLDPALHTRTHAEALVARAVRVKVAVVQDDPFEHGVRAHLNLGHTFAHAVEQVSGYAWRHGEAVGVGLVAAARLSARLGLCDDALPGHVAALVGGVGLPVRLPQTLPPDALWHAMHTDKKWHAGRNRFVLLRAVGAPCIAEDVARADVIAVLEGLAHD